MEKQEHWSKHVRTSQLVGVPASLYFPSLSTLFWTAPIWRRKCEFLWSFSTLIAFKEKKKKE